MAFRRCLSNSVSSIVIPAKRSASRDRGVEGSRMHQPARICASPVPDLRSAASGMTLEDVSGSWFPDGFASHRLRPLSPLEGEMSACADRGGARRFGRNRPLRRSQHRWSPPLSGPRTSSPQGGRGVQGAGPCRVQGVVSQHSPDLAVGGRSCLLSLLGGQVARSAARPDVPGLSSPRKRGPRTFHGPKTALDTSARESWVPDLRFAASGMTLEDVPGSCFPDGSAPHRLRALSPLEGEMSACADRGEARRFGRNRPLRGSQHRCSPPLSGSRISPPQGGKGAQGAGLCRVQELGSQHSPDRVGEALSRELRR